MFAATFDGDREDYAAELSGSLGSGLEAILVHCSGYVAGTAKDAQRFQRFVRDHLVKHHTFVHTFPGLTVSQIRRNAQLRALAESLLTADQRRESAGARVPMRPTVTASRALPAAAGANPLSQLFDALVNRLTGIKPGAPNPNVHAKAHDLANMEDRVVQNQMTTLSPNKPGRFPRTVLRIGLWLADHQDFLMKGGVLPGLSQIHFARWSIVDGGDNLLFESNYDGSWESYIDAFVDNNSTGMNLIWGNGLGYPPGGCKDIESFHKAIRDYQFKSQVFYSAYPDLTVRNISNDLRVSETLQRTMSVSELEMYAGGYYPMPGSRS